MSGVPSIKTGDRLPIFRALLKDPGGGVANLATATGVAFSMRSNDSSATAIYRAAASIVDTATGEVAYAWQAGDTDVAGQYSIEWAVTYPGGLVMTYPGSGFNEVVIEDGIPAA